MIEKLKKLFSSPQEIVDNPDSETIQLAAASLLVEVIVADEHVDQTEQLAVTEILEQLFDINKSEIDQLFLEARKASHNATSLYQFTRLINDHYRAEDKYQLVMNLWRVAYADGHLDKYEEGVIRRICELIYVPHSQFIRAKTQVRDQA